MCRLLWCWVRKAVSVNPRHDTAMLAKILIVWCLVATTVMFHAAALGIMLNPVLRLTGQLETRFLPVTWLVVRITWWLIIIHLVEIALWALFFWKCSSRESCSALPIRQPISDREDCSLA